MAEIEIHPCDEHRGILNPSFPWDRALDVADECPACEVRG
jgi:hypothetical protein